MSKTEKAIIKKCSVSLKKEYDKYGSNLNLQLTDSGDIYLDGRNYSHTKVDNMVFLKNFRKELDNFIEYLESGKEPVPDVPVKQWYEFWK